jgi:hypothetical protein
VYVLAFATIMLNTDLHNRNVKKKWTKAQFVNSLAEFNDGRNYEKEFLEDLYQTIALDEVADSRFNLAFKRGWLKVSVGKAKKRTRWVVLDKSGLYVFKSQVCVLLPALLSWKTADLPLHSPTPRISLRITFRCVRSTPSTAQPQTRRNASSKFTRQRVSRSASSHGRTFSIACGSTFWPQQQESRLK